jgi:cysteine desulfurase
MRVEALAALAEIGAEPNGEPERTLATTVNVSVPGVDAEAAMVALKGVVAISNGSACTSHSYSPSHVLEAMGLDSNRVAGALRLSWSHLTPPVDWAGVVGALGALAPA